MDPIQRRPGNTNWTKAELGPSWQPIFDALEKADNQDDHANSPEDFDVIEIDGALALTDPAIWDGVPPPERQWVLQDWLPAGHAAYITGAGAAGKSLLGQVLVTAVSLGLPFMGIETEARRALYVTCEDDLDELHRRQAAICAGLEIGMGDLAGKLFLLSRFGEIDNAAVVFDRDGNMAETPTWQRLRASIEKNNIDLVVLDNTAHIFADDENNRAKVTMFASLLGKQAKKMGGSVLLIGHPNKAGDAYSGSTAWENAFRARLYLQTHADSDGTEDPYRRDLIRSKSNYAEKGKSLTIRWHEGTFLLDGDDRPSVASEMRVVSLTNRQNDAFMDCLRQRTAEGEGRAVGPSPGPNYAPSQFEGMAKAKGFKKDVLKRAMDRLFAIGAIESVQIKNPKSGRTAHVIRETDSGQDISHNASHNAAQHSRTTPHNPQHNAAQPSTTHTLYPTDISGGAFSPGPPDQSEWREAPEDDLDWSGEP